LINDDYINDLVFEYFDRHDYCSIGLNPEKRKKSNLLWHNEFGSPKSDERPPYHEIIDEIFCFFYRSRMKNPEITALGQEDVVMPIYIEELEKLVSRFKRKFSHEFNDFIEDSGNLPSVLHDFIFKLNQDSYRKTYSNGNKKIELSRLAIACNSALEIFKSRPTEDLKYMPLGIELGLTFHESKPIVRDFYKEINRNLSDKVYHHNWQRGDVLIFHNKKLMHSRIPVSKKPSGSLLYAFFIELKK